MNESSPPKYEDREKIGFLQAVGSALAAAFGVSSARKRERDFKHGKASTFIIAGLVLTVLFVLCIVGVVKLALRASGQ